MRANGSTDMVAADDIMPDMIDTVFVQQIMIGAGRAVNNGIIGTAGKNEYFPIANNQMNYVQGLYHQNKGY